MLTTLIIYINPYRILSWVRFCNIIKKFNHVGLLHTKTAEYKVTLLKLLKTEQYTISDKSD